MKLVKALVAAATLLLAVIAVPSTAHAADVIPVVFESPSSHTCPSGHVCLYSGSLQTGTVAQWRDGDWTSNFRRIGCRLGCPNGNFNDVASSWYNNTGRLYCVSAGINGGNPDNSMPPRSGGPFTPDWNDRASSLSLSGCP